MQLHTEKKEVLVGGAKSTTEFSMQMNAKAFRVLSDGLYQNKIGSLVREICCNAKDAHTQAGKSDIPFTVHLPDITEPWFSVQDYGVGLSPQQITDIYCQFFQSTKDQSNDQVGAFGLGSKTPFAYDENFTVTSVFDGMEYHYSAYLDDNGMPTISLMQSNETDKCNGLTVKVGVKRDDFQAFRQELKEQLKYFNVKPSVTNYSEFTFPKLTKATMTVGGVEILNSHYSGGIVVIQGGVGYPLDYYQLIDKVADENKNVLNVLNDASARIYFDIGQIEVTASREGIEYKSFTIKNIENKIEQFKNEMSQELDNILSSKANDWERACELSKSGTLRRIAASVGYSVPNTFTNRRGSIYFNAQDIFTEKVEYDYTLSDGTITKNHKFNRYFKIVKYRKLANGNISMKSNEDSDTLHASTDVNCLYIRDTSSKPVSRIKNHMIENDMDFMLVVCVCPDNDKTPNTAFDNSIIKKIKDSFGGLSIKKVSSLDAPKKAIKSTATKSHTPTGYVLSSNQIYRLDNYNGTYDWDRTYTFLDEIEPSVYVECDRYAIDESREDIRKMLALVNCGIISDMVIYGFNKANSARIQKIDGWVSLSDYVEKHYSKIESKFASFGNVARIGVLAQAVERQLNLSSRVEKQLYKEVKRFDAGSYGRWFFKALIVIPKLYERMINVMSEKSPKDYAIFHNLRADILTSAQAKMIDEGDAVLEKIMKAESTFRLIHGTWSKMGQEKLEHIAQYVNCMSKGA